MLRVVLAVLCSVLLKLSTADVGLKALRHRLLQLYLPPQLMLLFCFSPAHSSSPVVVAVGGGGGGGGGGGIVS